MRTAAGSRCFSRKWTSTYTDAGLIATGGGQGKAGLLRRPAGAVRYRPGIDEQTRRTVCEPFLPPKNGKGRTRPLEIVYGKSSTERGSTSHAVRAAEPVEGATFPIYLADRGRPGAFFRSPPPPDHAACCGCAPRARPR